MAAVFTIDNAAFTRMFQNLLGIFSSSELEHAPQRGKGRAGPERHLA
jgi:hypothetical protein